MEDHDYVAKLDVLEEGPYKLDINLYVPYSPRKGLSPRKKKLNLFTKRLSRRVMGKQMAARRKLEWELSMINRKFPLPYENTEFGKNTLNTILINEKPEETEKLDEKLGEPTLLDDTSSERTLTDDSSSERTLSASEDEENNYEMQTCNMEIRNCFNQLQNVNDDSYQFFATEKGRDTENVNEDDTLKIVNIPDDNNMQVLQQLSQDIQNDFSNVNDDSDRSFVIEKSRDTEKVYEDDTLKIINIPHDNNMQASQQLSQDMKYDFSYFNDNSLPSLFTEKSTYIQKEYEDDALRIVNIPHIFKQLQEFDRQHISCGIQNMKIIDLETKSLNDNVKVQCRMCGIRNVISCQPDLPNRVSLADCAVAATMISGAGKAQMEQFFAACNIPCMSNHQYTKRHEKLVIEFIKAAEKEMIAAAKEETRLAIERGDVLPSGIAHIPVVADGSWMTRSYRTGKRNSASGVGVIVGFYSKKVLFTGQRNRECVYCNTGEKTNSPSKKHVCYKNWDKNRPSAFMEWDAICEGFKTSVEKRKLVYSMLIADGDSTVYKKILDLDPYASFEVRVQKIECTNHLLRNFRNKMNVIVRQIPRGPLRKTVDNSIRRMRSSIVKAAGYRFNQKVLQEEKIEYLRKDIINMPSHVFGEHENCLELGYFCNGPKENERNIVPDLKQIEVYEHIQKILRPLLNHANSLLFNVNNNLAEAFNSIVSKYIGGKRLNFGQRGSYTGRVAAAVVQFNTKRVLSRLCISMGKEPHPYLFDLEDRMQLRRRTKERIESRKSRNIFRDGKDLNFEISAQDLEITAEDHDHDELY